jgi:hypothetical protein
MRYWESSDALLGELGDLCLGVRERRTTSALWHAPRIIEAGASMSGERRGGVERKKERLRALLRLAAQDTDAAKLLAEHGNHYAAYHCQQAAEKLIRVLLLHHDIEPGLDHHLDVLPLTP